MGGVLVGLLAISTGGLYGCVAELAVGCVLCTAVLMLCLTWPVGHAGLLLSVCVCVF